MSRHFVTIFARDGCNRVLLTEQADGQIWLPNVPIDGSESVDETYKFLLSSCGVEATAPATLYLRSRSVGSARWFNYLYKVKVRITTSNRSRRILMKANTLPRNSKLRSDEIISKEYFLKPVREMQHSIVPNTAELETLFEALGFDSAILEALHRTIIDEVWPCERYSEESFKCLTYRLYGRELPKCSEIFQRSVCEFAEKHADPENILTTLALMEPASENDETRCRFIYDFYHQQQDDRLSLEELDEVLRDLCTAKPELRCVVPDGTTLCEILQLSHGSDLSLSEFSQLVRSGTFPGADLILRAPRSIYQHFMYDALSAPPAGRTPDPSFSRISHNCANFQEGANAYSLTRLSIGVEQASSFNFSPWRGSGTRDEQNRMIGPEHKDWCDPSIVANHMLGLLRYYVVASDSKVAWSLGKRSIDEYYQTMNKVCELATSLFLGEKRVLQVRGPAYVFGDLHGNYSDLLQFERTLWPMGPSFSPCSIVFIGDFVDCSRHGFLLMAHLLSCKILAPHQFFLVRGNHGLRSLCRNLMRECHEFFIEDESHGNSMFKRCADVFDHLPLAAVIDEKIFCVHGGFADGSFLPFGVEAVDLIPNPLPFPKKHPLARQLLWLDSQNPEDQVEESEDTLFSGKKRRKIAQTFTSNALRKFLERNCLSFVIRGHQYIDPALRSYEDERLITVYSSSCTCGRSSTEADFAVVDSNEVKLIRFAGSTLSIAERDPETNGADGEAIGDDR